jgi:hypothetical protein
VRYVEITHVYMIPVPAEDEDSIDAIANHGVSIMENFMKGRAANIRDLRSDWKLVPRGYGPSDEPLDLAQIPIEETPGYWNAGPPAKDAPSPITHPWDQGLRVTPRGHDLFAAETAALAQEGMLCGEKMTGHVCVGVKNHRDGEHIWVSDSEVKQLDA